jgi:hypothetical protein
MTLRTPTMILGLAGALALAACSSRQSSEAQMTVTPTPAAQAQATQPAPPRPQHVAARAPRATIVPVSAKVAVDARDLLNQGTDINQAASGFRTQEQFLAVAHAARNLGVPFVVLRDHVLRRRQSLARAIRDLKPRVNASAQANLANAQARVDLAGHL